MPTVYQTGQSVDHYTIIDGLGQGGASHVYLARAQHTQQEVVLKFPHIDEIGSADVFANYQREREIGRYLSHPRIQRHLDSGRGLQRQMITERWRLRYSCKPLNFVRNL